jgi:hypothetical protein
VIDVTVLRCERQGVATYLLDMPVGITSVTKGDHVTDEGRCLSTIRFTELNEAVGDEGASYDVLGLTCADALEDDTRLLFELVVVSVPRKRVVKGVGKKCKDFLETLNSPMYVVVRVREIQNLRYDNTDGTSFLTLSKVGARKPPQILVKRGPLLCV